MSVDPQSGTLQDRIADKWQLPLALLSAVALTLTILLILPQKPAPSLEARLAQINELKHGLLLPEAAALARSLAHDEACPPEQAGPLYGELADVLFRMEARRGVHVKDDLVQVLAVYAQAEVLGHRPDAGALRNQGQIYEWLGQPGSALELYEQALQQGAEDPLALRQKSLSLRLHAVPTAPAELHRRLDRLIRDAHDRPDILAWAVEEYAHLLLGQGRPADAGALLADARLALAETPHADLLDYLSALLQYRRGDFAGAESTLRNFRSRRNQRDELQTKAAWLLGRVVLMDDGPQRPLQAMTFFQEVLDAHASRQYVSAARLGMAEALTDLQRFEEAKGFYRAALEDARKAEHNRLFDRNAVRNSLTVRSRLLNAAEEYDVALDYLQWASDLVPLDDPDTRALYLQDLILLKRFLAERYRAQAQKEQDSSRAQQAQLAGARSQALFLSSAGDYLELSDLAGDEESQAAEALWQAANMFDSAGARRQTIALLEQFLSERPSSDQVPFALFRLGQAYQARGDLELAVKQYQRCIRDFHRTTPAQQSYIPLADCFIMLGPKFFEHAEITLLDVVEQDPGEPVMFTPQSLIYRNALFRLGDLYSRDARYEDAIVRLEEALQRYPADQRYARATFLLADAYRHSGLELERSAGETANALRREALGQERRRRLRQAERLFERVIDELQGAADKLSAMEALQLKLSYAYRADCAFDLGEQERALALYQEVVRAYQDRPLALAAYVQMISCYESLGRRKDITPALQRALWLTDKIDERQFAERVTRNRPQDWKQLFQWIAETGGYN